MKRKKNVLIRPCVWAAAVSIALVAQQGLRADCVQPPTGIFVNPDGDLEPLPVPATPTSPSVCAALEAAIAPRFDQAQAKIKAEYSKVSESLHAVIDGMSDTEREVLKSWLAGYGERTAVQNALANVPKRGFRLHWYSGLPVLTLRTEMGLGQNSAGGTDMMPTNYADLTQDDNIQAKINDGRGPLGIRLTGDPMTDGKNLSSMVLFRESFDAQISIGRQDHVCMANFGNYGDTREQFLEYYGHVPADCFSSRP